MNLGTKIAIGVSIIFVITGIVLAIVFTRPVDCVVSDWFEWTNCDKRCGTGSQTRERSIITQPLRGGLACPVLTEKRACKIKDCPVDCVVSEWSEWSDCNKTCGGGTQNRTKRIITNAQYGGTICPPLTSLTESRDCNIDLCSNTIENPNNENIKFIIDEYNKQPPGNFIILDNANNYIFNTLTPENIQVAGKLNTELTSSLTRKGNIYYDTMYKALRIYMNNNSKGSIQQAIFTTPDSLYKIIFNLRPAGSPFDRFANWDTYYINSVTHNYR